MVRAVVGSTMSRSRAILDAPAGSKTSSMIGASDGSEAVKRRIYIETTIPSFYFDVRSEPEMVARRAWTREWWAVAADQDEIVASAAVLEELGAGDHPNRTECLPALVTPLELLGEGDGKEG